MLFTKPPRPGRVKTRLVGEATGELTPERAAALHWAFVLDLLGRLEDRDFALEIAWAAAPEEPVPDLGVPSFRQEGVDLGARLWHGLSKVAAVSGHVAAIGSDHPMLTLDLVSRGFDRLDDSADVVLGPAADGGYYLVGVRSRCLENRLFEEIPWSSSQVLEKTLERCAELGLTADLLPEGHDVDTPADLGVLATRLAAGVDGCPRTRDLLGSWGLLA